MGQSWKFKRVGEAAMKPCHDHLLRWIQPVYNPDREKRTVRVACPEGIDILSKTKNHSDHYERAK